MYMKRTSIKLFILVLGLISFVCAEIAAAPSLTVTYNANGGTGGSVPVDAKKYEQGQSVTVLGNTKNMVRAGFVFSGWNTAANMSGEKRAVGSTFKLQNQNVTLYAVWSRMLANTIVPQQAIVMDPATAAKYFNRVAFDSQSATTPANPTSLNVAKNNASFLGPLPTAPKKTGFAFGGWYTAPNGAGSEFKVGSAVTANITVYANWKEAGTGGLGSTSSPNVPGESVPAGPTNLGASQLFANSIRLRWNDNANNEQGFKIEKSTSSSSGFAQIAVVAANVTSYDHTGLAAGTYYYRVRAYNSNNASPYSNVASANLAGTTSARELKIVNNLAGTSMALVNVLQLRVGNNVSSTPSTEVLSPDNYSSATAPGLSIEQGGRTKTIPINSSNYSVFIGLGMWSWTSAVNSIGEVSTTQGYWSKKLFGMNPNNDMFWIFCNMTINNHTSGIVTLTLTYAGNNMIIKMGNQTFNFSQSFTDPITVHH
jgi:uncharacterized repeat protein (TIGR02543 family)